MSTEMSAQEIIERVVVSDAGRITDVAREIASRFDLGSVLRVEPLFGATRRNARIETDTGSWILRVAPSPTRLGSARHQRATGGDVLRRERFFAGAIRQTTGLSSPWPYEIDLTCDVLPSPYAVMPRLPGRTLWWAEDRDWAAVGVALADAALALHRPAWAAPGEWDPTTDDLVPSNGTAATRCRTRVAGLRARLAGTSEPLDDESARWVEEQLASVDTAPAAGQTSLIHGDLVIGNVCMHMTDRGWSVTGVFDLESARVGDPEEDLVGHLWWACYCGRPEAATSFMRRYREARDVSGRIWPYTVISLLAVWEFGRGHNEPWFGNARTFADWAKPLYALVDHAVVDALG
jgi:aminoglycoside phosphotransferase (APT) family kinase protein